MNWSLSREVLKVVDNMQTSPVKKRMKFSELPGVIGGHLIEDDSQFLSDKVLCLGEDIGLHRCWLAGDVRALVDGALGDVNTSARRGMNNVHIQSLYLMNTKKILHTIALPSCLDGTLLKADKNRKERSRGEEARGGQAHSIVRT